MSDSRHTLDPDALIKSNPRVDGDQFREAQVQLRRLREQGISKPGYGIQPEHERAPIVREPGVHGKR
jgi:hypothetical protein